MAPNPIAKALAVWHGSPHDFEKFEWDKIGTGEGNQTYGMGHYLAGNRTTAEWYRDRLSGRNPNLTMGGMPFDQDYSKISAATNRVAFEADNNRELREHALAQKANGFDTFGHWVRSKHPFNGMPIDHVLSLLDQQDASLKKLRESDLPRMHEEFERKYGIALPRDTDSIATLDNVLSNMKAGLNAQEAWDEARQIELAPWEWEPEGPSPNADVPGVERERQKVIDTFDRIKPIVDQVTPNVNDGKLYEIDLHLNPHQMLDWDSPMTEQHPVVKKTLQHMLGGTASDRTVGREIYYHLVTMHKGFQRPPDEATAWLKRQGIYGIRYLDEGSRSKTAPRWFSKVDDRPAERYQRPLIPDEDLEPMEHIDRLLKNAVKHPDQLEKHFEDSISQFRDALKKLTPQNDYNGDKEEAYEAGLDKLITTRDWMRRNHHRLAFEQDPDQRTFNYVAFDDNLINIVRKLGMKGELIKEFPRAVVLRAVDHDPFAGASS